jgi:hypothetical protein
MKGKISKIKNTKGELALPVTTVEAVYLEDGKTKLSDEIKDVLKYEVLDDEGIIAEIPDVIEEIDGIKKDIGEINSSLETKASKNEVFSMANMGQDIKEAMTGGSVAVVGKNAVLEENIVDNQVTPRKTNFFFQSKNLFNKNDIVTGKFITWNSGVIIDNPTYNASNFIAVKENTLYTRNLEHQMAFYDENKNYISGIYGADSSLKYSTFTTPANTRYIRVTIIPRLLNSIQIIEGDETNILSNYISFGYGISEEFFNQTVVKENNILDGCINDTKINPNSKILILESSKNLFNKNTVTDKYFINWNNGALYQNDNYYSSDFIEVTPNSKITRSYDTHIAFYDTNKTFISGLERNNSDTVTTPSNCKYIRIDIDKRNYDIQSFQVEYGEQKTSYEEYGLKYPTSKNNIPIFLPKTDNTNVDKFKQSRLYGKKVSWYGTSITQGYGWCNLVNRLFNFNATNNGVGGTTICKENKNASMCTVNRMLGKYSSVTDPNNGQVTLTGTPIPTDVEVIFIEGGTNDWARNWAIGDKEFTENPNDQTFAGACHLMFKNMTELFPNAEIIIVGSPFGKMENRTSFTNKYGILNNQNLQTIEYGDILLDVAGKWGIKGFNMGREMQVHDNNVSTLIPDGLHLTTKEVQEMASNVIINYLLSLN